MKLSQKKTEKLTHGTYRAVFAPYSIWSLLFVIVPLLFVAYYAFTDNNFAFTTEHIMRFFTAKSSLVQDDGTSAEVRTYLLIFLRSLKLAVISTAICLLLGYPIAYIMAHAKEKTQKTMMTLIMIPMWMNFLIRTYAWMNILEDSGLINRLLAYIGVGPLKMINTPGAVILGMVYNFLPYMILPIYTVLTKLDKSLVEAAQDLGAGKIHVFSKVVFPCSVSGIVSGITMVFVPSVSTFYISQKLGGGTFALIGDVIEMQFQVSNNFNFGAALSLVLMVLILICMAFMNKFSSTEDAGGGMVL